MRLTLLLFLLFGTSGFMLFAQKSEFGTESGFGRLTVPLPEADPITRITLHRIRAASDTLHFPAPPEGKAWYVTFNESSGRNIFNRYRVISAGQTVDYGLKVPEAVYRAEKAFDLVLISEGHPARTEEVTVSARLVGLPPEPGLKKTEAETLFELLPVGDCKATANRAKSGPYNGDDYWVVCKGKCKGLAGGGFYEKSLADNFNGKFLNDKIWDSYNGELKTGCGSPDRTGTFWFGSPAASRFAVSRNFQFSDSIGRISFKFRYGKASDTTRADDGCEQADLPVENVRLQWSQGGNNWIDLIVFNNGGDLPGPYDDWKEVCYQLPRGSGKLRFYQEAHSGLGFDQWAIEDFKVDVVFNTKNVWKDDKGNRMSNPDNVCPEKDTEYTYEGLDEDGIKVTSFKKVMRVIGESQIAGTVTTTKTLYCPEDQPEPLKVTGYNGIVRNWEFLTDCDSVSKGWRNTNFGGPVFVPGPLKNNICYRALVDASGCVARSAPIKLMSTLTEVGKVVSDKDSVCEGEPVTFRTVEHLAEVVRWEWSGNNKDFNLLREQPTETLTIPITRYMKFVRAVIRYPSCADSAAAATRSFAFKHIGWPSYPEKRFAYGDCQTPMKEVAILYTRPEEVTHWEQLQPGGSWTQVNATENKVVLTGNPFLPAGSVYRVKLNPAMRPNKCDPPLEYLERITIPQDILCCCSNLISDSLCAGTIIDQELCVSPNCGRPLRFERAYNPGNISCRDWSLNWEELPSENMDSFTGCYRLNEFMERSFCIRAVIRHPFDPDNVAFGGVALYKVKKEVTKRGKLRIRPEELCINYNNALISVSDFDFSLKVKNWQSKPLNASEEASWTDVPSTKTRNLSVSNLKQDLMFRIAWGDSITDCEYYSDTLQVKLHPNGEPGQITGDSVLCSSSQDQILLQLKGYSGESQRWELNDNSKCTGNWNIVNTIKGREYHIVNPPYSQSRCYRAVVRYNDCEEMYTRIFLVNVNTPPEPGLIKGANDPICAGGPGPELSLEGNTGRIVRWERTDDCVDWAKNIVTIAHTEAKYQVPSISQNTCFRVILREGLCESPSIPVQVSIRPESFPGKLFANGNVCKGGRGSLDLSESTGRIMRWESSEDDKTWKPINHTLRSYQTPPLTRRTCYRLWIKMPVCPEGPTDPVCINVSDDEQIGTLDPLPAICKGKPLPPVRIKGNKTDVTQWEADYGCNNTYQNFEISSSNPNVFLLSASLEYDLCIRARISRQPCGDFYTNVIKIEVIPDAIGGYISDHQTVCLGNDPQKLVLTDAVGKAAYWESSHNEVDWVLVAGSLDTNQIQPRNLTRTTYFRATVKSGNCSEVMARFAKVMVITNDGTLGSLSAPQTICEGASPQTIKLSETSLTVKRWESSAECTGTWTTINHTGKEYSPPALSSPTCYRAVLGHPLCADLTTPPIKISLIKKSATGWLTGDVVACQEQKEAVMRLRRYSGDIVKWQKKTGDGTWTDISNRADSLKVTIDFTTVYRVVLSSSRGSCVEPYSSEWRFEDVLPANPGFLSASQTVCSENRPQQLVLSGHSGSVIRWEVSNNNGTTWADAGNRGIDTFQPPLLNQTVLYRVITGRNGCPPVISPSVKIEVKSSEAKGVLSGDSIYCPNLAPPVIRLTGYTGTIIQWETSTDNLSWARFPSTTANFSPLGSWNQLWVRAKVNVKDCGELTTASFKVTRKAAPRAGSISSSAVICSGQRSPGLIVRNHSGSIIRWEFTEDSTGSWTPIPNTPVLVYLSGPLTKTTWYRVIIGNSDCGTVASAPVKITVRTSGVSEVLGLIKGNNTICQGQNVRLELTGFTGTINRWEYTDDNGANHVSIPGTTNTLIFGQRMIGERRYRARMTTNCGSAMSPYFSVRSVATPELTVRTERPCGSGRTRIIARSNIPGVTFSISPAIQSSNSSGLFSDLPDGTYMVTAQTADGCRTQTQVRVNNLTVSAPSVHQILFNNETSATVRWNRVGSGNYQYTLRWRQPGGTWTQLPATSDTSVTITGLRANTDYETEVMASCEGKNSSWSTGPVRTFRTPTSGSDCRKSPIAPPSNLRMVSRTNRTARVVWSRVNNTVGYIVTYGLMSQNTSQWIQITVCAPDTSLLIAGLTPGMSYGVRVRTNCTNCTTAFNPRDNRSNWSNVITFQTPVNKTPKSEEPVSGLSAAEVYPNPFRSEFFLKLDSGEPVSSETKFDMYDLNGKLLLSRSVTEPVTEIPTHDLPEGIYLIRLTDGTEVKTFKVIKAHP